MEKVKTDDVFFMGGQKFDNADQKFEENFKDRTADNNLLNVAVSQAYGVNYGTTVSFPSSSIYPYQYTPYDRTVTANVPSLGFNQSDKIRFEQQTLVEQL